MDTPDKIINIHIDAFSNGQMDSKLWLCEELEKILTHKQTVWIYGGWYGVLSLLLLSRGILPINCIRSFDIDPTCEITADKLLENWKCKNWKFKAITTDCNSLKLNSWQNGSTLYGDSPSLIINTSSEHFTSLDWFNNIPSGMMVAIQSNNMIHDDHYSNVNSLNELKNLYPLSEIKMCGEKEFIYPDWKFDRYMIIGIK